MGSISKLQRRLVKLRKMFSDEITSIDNELDKIRQIVKWDCSNHSNIREIPTDELLKEIIRRNR